MRNYLGESVTVILVPLPFKFSIVKNIPIFRERSSILFSP